MKFTISFYESGDKMIDTYTMQYTCSNCGASFEREVKKGTEAKGMGGECGYCGIKDSHVGFSFSYKRPYWLIHAESIQNINIPNKQQ